METELNGRLAALEKKVDELNASAKTIKSYFFWLIVITIVVSILPLLGLFSFAPSVMGTYTTGLEGL